MSSSFKDQLLGLGFKNSPKAVAAPARSNTADKRKAEKPQAIRQSKPAKSDEMDLAKAFAMRTQDERRQREQAEREKQEQARLRRIAKENVAELLKDHVLNKPDAEIARHFPYGGKIKRIYVTAEQLIDLNSGKLAVVQQAGKYCLVDASIAIQIKALIPSLIALHCDGTEQTDSDEYIDSKFQVPDDLIW